MDTIHFENIHLEEEEETLSLRDLPLHGDDWEQDFFSQELTSFSSSENDFFEFFSQEYFNPTPPSGIQPENIIFCGKLFPYKQPYSDAKSSSESRKQEAHTEKDQDCGVSRWNFDSSSSNSERCIDPKNIDKTRAIPLSLAQKKDKGRHVSSPMHNSPNKVKECDLQVQKFPMMASSSSGKSKWYLFLSGIPRFSNSIELNGVNSRRIRRQNPPPAFRNISDDGDRGWRMGGLIGALSCGGHSQADTMVAASICRAALK
ncbi:uncharacterized protein [Primulina huaijiensis]|uniref:uncharacterized protein n=1 Tax=Primulina huaijiensis TaxID=1492673 RepID=UPI003CC75BB0